MVSEMQHVIQSGHVDFDADVLGVPHVVTPSWPNSWDGSYNLQVPLPAQKNMVVLDGMDSATEAKGMDEVRLDRLVMEPYSFGSREVCLWHGVEVHAVSGT